jgi:hypothetical protein
MKKIVRLIAAVILAALIAAGGFWGGMAYQTSRASQARANFINARGGANGMQLPDGVQGFPGGAAPSGLAPGAFGGRGTTGQVKAVDGNVITLSTAQDVTTVSLSDSTQIQKTVAGTAADLQPGLRVMVTGEMDNGGKLTASQVTILAEAAGVEPRAAPAGTEP